MHASDPPTAGAPPRDTVRLSPPAATGGWTRVADAVADWLVVRRIAARDAVVLLPFAELLPALRAAFASHPGWPPRVETPRTLAMSLAPPPDAQAGECTGDAVVDGVTAAAALRRSGVLDGWAERDRQAFASAVAAVVEAAASVLDAAHARPPPARAAFFEGARQRLPAASPGVPGALEASLLRFAVEWAAGTPPPATDVLFGLRPAAWIVVRLGGPDALAEAVAAAAGVPVLNVDLDPPDPLASLADAQAPLLRLCAQFEAEAVAAAHEVASAVDAGRVPVAVVTADRRVARRVRALLERSGIAVADETGWRLSTTRSAAAVAALLHAARSVPAACVEPPLHWPLAPDPAAADAVLEWLKEAPAPPSGQAAVDALEALWRGQLVDDAGRAAALELRERAWATLAALRGAREATLAAWLAGLGHALASDAAGVSLWSALAADAAGVEVLRALRFDDHSPAWRGAASTLRMDFDEFADWVGATLEHARFVPPHPQGADVVMTPLARAAGRPFAQVVMPGCDASHLAPATPGPALVPDRLAAALGLPDADERRRRQQLAFAHLVHAPAVTLLRRSHDGDEPLAAAPLLEALVLARRAAGRPAVADAPAGPPPRRVAVRPVARPLPVVPADALPAALSASQVEALRQCPYRFFAQSVLRLRDEDEIDVEPDARIHGNWLHEALHRFHRDRDPTAGAEADALRLHAAADAALAAAGLEGAAMLPYRAAFAAFAPGYLRWVRSRDAAGWRWRDGEFDLRAAPDPVAPQTLRGRIDRLDEGPGGVRQVIDYKSGASTPLRDRVRMPLEDTQLAFYALLAGAAAEDAPPLEAIYLALDEPQAPVEVQHPDVVRSARALLAGLADDLARMRAGAPLPALGEGRACDWCEMRGLCRRDHWADGGAAVAADDRDVRGSGRET
ncbi:MAG: PD-(D/E)XK nuclease family protein [Rubrivivax sp.]|nr:PD-(D/E)XK nuclease family protein [Rubrivivax sp.]